MSTGSSTNASERVRDRNQDRPRGLLLSWRRSTVTPGDVRRSSSSMTRCFIHEDDPASTPARSGSRLLDTRGAWRAEPTVIANPFPHPPLTTATPRKKVEGRSLSGPAFDSGLAWRSDARVALLTQRSLIQVQRAPSVPQAPNMMPMSAPLTTPSPLRSALGLQIGSCDPSSAFSLESP